MYNLTRQETADKLWISTRSVDRYVKSGKLRSKKEGKIIYIHASDVANLSGTEKKWPEVIVEKKRSFSSVSSQHSSESTPQTQSSTAVMDAQSRATLEKIYLDLRQEIKQKDKMIQDLSIRLGQSQEIAKNSVSLVEFKKSQFLLEESKGHMTKELSGLKQQAKELEQKLKYEKNTNYLLITFCIIMIIGLWLLWFLKI